MPLLHNTIVPMYSGAPSDHEQWSVYFRGQSRMDNSNNPVDVGIGYQETVGLKAKLDVKDSTFGTGDFNYVNQYAGRFYQTGNYSNHGDDMVGVAGITDVVHADDNSSNFGGDFSATNSKINNVGARATASCALGTNYGVQGYALDAGTTTGVYGESNGTTSSIGVQGYANGTATNYGVYGNAATGAGVLSYAGYFDGDLAYTGALISIFDSMVKQNIHPITNAQAILNQVHPKVYNFDTAQYGYMYMKGGTEYGVLAQDLQNVLPTAVKNLVQPGDSIHPPMHLKGVDYIEFIPLLIQSNHQMDSTIQALQSQLIALQNCCDQRNPPPNSIKHGDGGDGDNGDGGSSEKRVGTGNIHSIELSSEGSTPMIFQNIPNPFNSGGTKIRYFVPDNTNNPIIAFYDEFGSRIKVFSIVETGMGELDVTATNLSSGVYSYSLIINNKVIDTKKMIFQK